MVVETRKILDPDIKVIATCVRVPVFIGHAEAVHVEFERPVTAAEARAVLREAPGVQVMDSRDDGGYITPADCAGEDASSSAASAATRRWRTGCRSGACPTTCARARR